MGWRKKMGVPDTPENNFAYFADIAYGIENLKTSSENHIKLPQYSRKVKNNNKNKVLNIYYRDVTQNTQNSKPDNSPKKAHSEPLTQNTQNTQNSSKNQILRKSPAKKQRCLHNRFCFFLTPGDQCKHSGESIFDLAECPKGDWRHIHPETKGWIPLVDITPSTVKYETCPAKCKRTGKCYGYAWFNGKPGKPTPCLPDQCAWRGQLKEISE